jgi:hypothetical protein
MLSSSSSCFRILPSRATAPSSFTRDTNTAETCKRSTQRSLRPHTLVPSGLIH